MRQICCGIYYIKNIVNNKYYIGQSINIYKRWAEEKLSLNSESDAWNIHLQRAWRKYGSDKFEFQIIEECEANILDDRERYWIALYDSYCNGYNQTYGGTSGEVYPQEVRLKKSESWTPEKRQECSEHSRQIWSDPDRLEQARQLQIQRWKDPIIRAKMCGANHHSSKWVFNIDTKQYYCSTTEAGKSINKTPSAIVRACKNSCFTAGGYHWRYATEAEIIDYLKEMGDVI